MEKTINRWIVITAVLGLIFAAAAVLIKSESAASASAVKYLPRCEYIDIDLLRLDVTVIPCDELKITLEYTNDIPLDIEYGDNRLSISESDRFVISLFAGSAEDFGLRVYLPREIYRELNIYTASGDIFVGGVDAMKLSAVSGSGNITSEDTCALASFISDYGDISVDFAYVIPDTVIQSRKGSGALRFPHGSSAAIEFDTISGRIGGDALGGWYDMSGSYGFNGGRNQIQCVFESGELTVNLQ
ncbi:MAG: DUF4097 family beta strand repeat-containing protein [Oscillospiraceae bacterium]